MEELAVTLPSGRVTLDDLPANVRDAAPRAGSQVQERTFDQTMEDTAKTLIVRAYAEYGSSYAVARHLNISQSKASRLIRKYIGAEKRIKSEVKR
jgi:transcriptional regulator of aromatic amino acid metabolism